MSSQGGTRTSVAPRTGHGGRSIYLDALRAFALIRVVVYHATASDWVTMFTAMPLMFFIAGSLYAASLERRPPRLVIRDRYRRILIPYWVYIVAMIGLWGVLGVLGELSVFNWIGMAFPVVSLNGPNGPGDGTPLELTWIALWYLQFHLILSLIGPWLRRMQRDHTRGTWIVVIGTLALGIVAGSGIVVIVFYVAAWILGYHQHDGHLEKVVERRWLPICGVAGPLGVGLFIAFEPSSGWSATSARLAVLGVALLGVFWLTLALGLRPWIEPLLAGHSVLTVVNWFSQRSLTIYMWHLVAIYAALELELPGTPAWPATLAWCCAFTVVAVVVVGWAEDLAARRPATLWPTLRTRPGAQSPG